MGGLLSRLNEEKKSEKSSTSTSSILEGASTQVLSSFEKLKEKGIVLARRTVAKHRTQLGYPIASVRKNIKR